jgi:hypothetical protein
MKQVKSKKGKSRARNTKQGEIKKEGRQGFKLEKNNTLLTRKDIDSRIKANYVSFRCRKE